MRAAKIDGQLFMDNASIKGELDMQDARVGSSLLMRNINLTGNASLIYVAIDGNLDLSSYYIPPHDREHCTLNRDEEKALADMKGRSPSFNSLPLKVDLTGARIGHALRLGSCKRRAPRWHEGAWLILRNASVRDLQDRDENCGAKQPDCRSAWPEHIDFDGLVFEHLGALDVDQDSNMAGRRSEWWVEWLAKQDWLYSPQPYEELASILAKLGYTESGRRMCFTRERKGKRTKRGGRQRSGFSCCVSLSATDTSRTMHCIGPLGLLCWV